MKFPALLTLSVVALAGAVQGAVPVFHAGELHLDSAATLTENGGHYYRNVVLRRDASGALRVEQAQPRPLVSVRSVKVNLYVADGTLASATITGLTSVACVVLEEPAMVRDGSTFHVILAETVQEPGAVCASLLPNQPFELALPLPIENLPDGTYIVDANGVGTTFTLGNP